MFPFIGADSTSDSYALVLSNTERIPLTLEGSSLSPLSVRLLQPLEGERVFGETSSFDPVTIRVYVRSGRAHYDVLSPITQPILNGFSLGTF